MDNFILTFGDSVNQLQQSTLSLKMERKGWNGKGIFVQLQRPDENSKMSTPYLFIDTTGLQTENEDAPKNRVPWAPSQTDMNFADWRVFE